MSNSHRTARYSNCLSVTETCSMATSKAKGIRPEESGETGEPRSTPTSKVSLAVKAADTVLRQRCVPLHRHRS
jgi:hypothetical protein